MDINLLPFTAVWMILAAVVISLIVYRKWVAKDEDNSLHRRLWRGDSSQSIVGVKCLR